MNMTIATRVGWHRFQRGIRTHDVGHALHAHAILTCFPEISALACYGSWSIKPGDQEIIVKIIASLLVTASLLGGCISSSSPPPPAKTTVVVPANSSGTTVVCQDGSHPPCN
jgi:hypothetical protein